MRKGFTLIELLVALGIFSVVMSAVVPAVINFAQSNTKNEQRMGAVVAAQQRLDELRLTDPATLPTSGSATANYDSGDRTYSVQTYYCSNTTYCATSTMRHIKVQVRYRNTLLYETETVYAQLS
jgi:type II secretion system protein I